MATIVLALWLAAGDPSPEPPGRWEMRVFWIEAAGAMAVPGKRALLLNADLMDLGLGTADGSQELQLPFLNVAGDLRRPSDPTKGSVSLSFLQAPLLAMMLGGALEKPPNDVARPAALAALLLLSGGTYRWYPGGTGNLVRSAERAWSAGLMLRNQFHVHLFLADPYVRQSSGLGLVLRRNSTPPWTDRLEPDFVCGVSAMFSHARDFSGRTASDTGIWFTCAAAYFGGY
jgi:hypothetical protein